MIRIRPAQLEDSAELIKLWHAGWHDAHSHLVPREILAYRSVDHFNMWLSECRDACYAARGLSELLGFVSIRGAEVVKLYVSAAARGSGIATALLSYAERELHRHGIIEAELYCTAGNLRAQKFYEREGWELSRTFEDALWLPRGVQGKYLVETRRYGKRLSGGWDSD